MNVHAIVPVKDPRRGKQRLASVLDAASRARLVRAMLADVLAALHDCPEISRVWIVSSDAALVPADCGHVADPGDGLNAAIAAALATATAAGAGSALVLPADVPEVRAVDLRALLESARSADVVVATDVTERGTNALVLSPPTAIAPAFGDDSRRRHEQVARAAGLRFSLCTTPALARDVDFPEHLASLALRDARYAAIAPPLREVG